MISLPSRRKFLLPVCRLDSPSGSRSGNNPAFAGIPLKILILKPSSLGDVVQAMPVLRMLKLHWPSAQIYWWIETNSASLLEGDPDLAGLISFDRKRWADPLRVGEVWSSINEMRRHR